MSLISYYSHNERLPLSVRKLEKPGYAEPPAFHDPSLYQPSEELSRAVDVAIRLGLPLLVTGEAGTGKTELAASVAYQLEAPFLRFDTKSTSTANDLLYEYDAIGRFNARNTESAIAIGKEPLAPSGEKPVVAASASISFAEQGKSDLKMDEYIERTYIEYQALGRAILLAQQPHLDRQTYSVKQPRWEFDADKKTCKPVEHTFSAPCRAVVLVDEVDKAPRDLPNDLLHELDRMTFSVREINREYIADPTYRPILILTSNSTKDFPDAFMRRCAYFHIPFPGEAQLRQIVAGRLAFQRTDDPYLTAAIALFSEIRSLKSKLKKPPATAELLSWVRLLQIYEVTQAEIEATNPQYNTPAEKREALAARLIPTYSVLTKNQDDRRNLIQFLHRITVE